VRGDDHRPGASHDEKADCHWRSWAIARRVFIYEVLETKLWLSGKETMVGKTVNALCPIDASGAKVFVECECWSATSDTFVKKRRTRTNS
jgi:membrane-bound ClpP family serine protease